MRDSVHSDSEIHGRTRTHTHQQMHENSRRERENLRLRGRGSLWKWDDDGMLGIEQGERGPLLPSLNLSNLIQRIRNVINDEGLL